MMPELFCHASVFQIIAITFYIDAVCIAYISLLFANSKEILFIDIRITHGKVHLLWCHWSCPPYKSPFLTNYFCIVISIESLRTFDCALGHNTSNIETFAVSLLHKKVSNTDCKPKLSFNMSRFAQNSAFIEIETSLTTIFWQKWRKFQDNLYDMIFSDYLLISMVEVDSNFNLLSNTCIVLSNNIIKIP